MATVTYQVLKKPIEDRIIDAACIYWGVNREYFAQNKGCTTATYRKGIIYYLMKQNSTCSLAHMAEMLGFISHQPVRRLVENIECTKDVYRAHLNDIEQIQILADKLDACFIQTEVKLIGSTLSVEQNG